MALFFFTNFQTEPPIEKGGRPKIIPVTDFFDPELVSRGRMFPDGSAIVVLRDGHEEDRDVDYQNKNGVKGTRKERIYLQSEIRLMPLDAARLRAIIEIDTAPEFEAEFLAKQETRIKEVREQQEKAQAEAAPLIITPEEAQASEN